MNMKPVSAIAASVIAGTALAQQPVTLRFDARVGNDAFACGRTYVSASNVAFAVEDFRFYIHDAQLLKADGGAVAITLEQDGKWQRDNAALLDFEDKTGACGNGTAETRHEVRGTVPAGEYRGVRFTLGLPFALNHQDATIAQAPFNVTSLFWNGRGGYKFARIDLVAKTADGRPNPFPIHLGSTLCTTASAGAMAGHDGAPSGGHGGAAGMMTPPTVCANPNRVTVEFNGFNPARDRIVADLGALIKGTDIRTNHGDMPGCMSAPNDNDCVAIMKNFGIAFRGVPGEQAFFRINRLLLTQ